MNQGPTHVFVLELTLMGEAWCGDCEAFVYPEYWTDGRWPTCPICGMDLGSWR